MKLKSLSDIDLKNKTVLYRAPCDIELEEKNGVLELADDLRIRAMLPSINYMLERNCRIVILTYVGRPDGVAVEELRTTPHARRLSELLNHPVKKADDCVGEEVDKKISEMQPKDILMLENSRFHKEEMADDDEFAKELCKGKDLVVFDGFPQAMRLHASTTGIERHLPAVAGFYLEHEVETLSSLLENPGRPFAVIIGGAKISDKVDSVNNLLKTADKVLVGGAVANVFLKALGRELGSSFLEDVFVDQKRRKKQDWVEYAREIMKAYGGKIVYPEDVIISDGSSVKVLSTAENIPEGWGAFDIGPKTQENFAKIIKNSKTVFLGGPMGKYEDERFVKGSEAVFSAMKDTNAKTIIAGGDTIDVARRCGSLDDYSHVSLAGGATLEFLAGKELPALIPLLS